MASPTPTGSAFTFTDSSGTTHTLANFVPGTGQNTALVLHCMATTGNNGEFTAATFNNVAMTQIYSVAGSRYGGGVMYFFASPSGTHDIVLTTAVSCGVDIVAYTLQDVKQTSPVDVAGINQTGLTGSSTSDSNSQTTLTNNDIVLGWLKVQNGASAVTAGQTQIAQLAGATAGGGGIFAVEYAAKATAGAQAMTWSWTQLSGYDTFTCSLKYVAPTPVGPTNVKTYDGVTQSTGIKTYDGVAVASVKTLNGVS